MLSNRRGSKFFTPHINTDATERLLASPVKMANLGIKKQKRARRSPNESYWLGQECG